jgi:RND family efflux transporter MFP subunit
VLAALLIVSSACSSPAADQPDEHPLIAVTVAGVERTEWPVFVEAGGALRARATAEVSSRILAPVTAVHVRAGDHVRRGQRLIDLDAAELHAQSARSTATLQSAELAARAAAAELAGAEAALTLARATHDRIRRLQEQRSATDQELDQALAALNAADARVSASRAQASAAAAALEAARAAAKAGTIVAEYGSLTAPFEARVIDRRIDPGGMATPGTPLLILEDTAAVRLHVQLDATRAAAIRPGAPAEVRIDTTQADAVWSDGRVDEVARVDPASQSFEVKIAVAAQPDWQSGLFGRARFRTGTRMALSAPAAAILRRGQLTLVFVIAADRARLRAVRTGDSFGDCIEILAGLNDGDRVIVNPPAGLDDGARIAIGAGR